MRLIFLSWAFPPMEFPRAVQVERLARHVDLCPFEIVCSGSGEERAGALAVHRIEEPRRRALGRWQPARLSAALAVPDPQRAWAARAAQALAATLPAAGDVLVTFGQPMSDHLAGLELKERFGCRWIAHFSDPWADNPLARAPFYRRRNLAFEARVLGAADHALFTSDETLDLVMRKYPPAWRRKTSVLPHAFEADLYPARGPAGDRLVLRYLGTLYGARSPAPVLRALERLARAEPRLERRLKVEFIGETAPRLRSAAARASLPPGLVAFCPPVPYARSLALMRDADLLLHIDAPARESVFLASKLIDYVGAGRPIVGVTPSGTAARLVTALGGWVADPASPDAIARQIAAAAAFVAGNREAAWGDETVRRRYDIETVARNFTALLERVARTPDTRPFQTTRAAEA